MTIAVEQTATSMPSVTRIRCRAVRRKSPTARGVRKNQPRLSPSSASSRSNAAQPIIAALISGLTRFRLPRSTAGQSHHPEGDVRVDVSDRWKGATVLKIGSGRTRSRRSVKELGRPDCADPENEEPEEDESVIGAPWPEKRKEKAQHIDGGLVGADHGVARYIGPRSATILKATNATSAATSATRRRRSPMGRQASAVVVRS